MTETLRIDTDLVLEAGGRLQAVANGIPEPPASFKPTGEDALSTAIAAKVAEVVDPVIAQLPVAKAELVKYAQNVVNAANAYDATDRQIAEEILKRLESVDDAPGASGAAVGAVSGGALGASSGTGQLGAMMPMAQQAAQATTQVAGVAGGIPQSVSQGVQQVVQQTGQLTEMAGEGAHDDAGELQHEQAGSGVANSESVPGISSPAESTASTGEGAGTAL
nr:type VII secretion target [Mycolicibacterium malmesburyense]CRL78599.1 translation initiation factor IF-2 [Mycolicibacterium malmesburyense]